jgi:hypothetical protein
LNGEEEGEDMKSDAVFLGGDESGDAEFAEVVAGPGLDAQIMHVDEDIKPAI